MSDEGPTPTTYQWDALNRLTALTEDTGATHSFAYDPNGIRCKMTDGGSTMRFLLAGEDIVEDLNPSGAGFNVATYYSHGPGIDEPLAQFKANATTPGYLHHDALGSVTAMTTSTGAVSGANVYNAYGTVANDVLPSSLTKVDARYGYTSRELDQSGLMYYRARYYTPETARFANWDPAPGDNDLPLTLHKYLYANASPISYFDPSGATCLLDWAEWTLHIIAVIMEILAAAALASALTGGLTAGGYEFFAHLLIIGIFVLGAAYSARRFVDDVNAHPGNELGYFLLFFMRMAFLFFAVALGPTAKSYIGSGAPGLVILQNCLYMMMILIVMYFAEAYATSDFRTAWGLEEAEEYESQGLR